MAGQRIRSGSAALRNMARRSVINPETVKIITDSRDQIELIKNQAADRRARRPAHDSQGKGS